MLSLLFVCCKKFFKMYFLAEGEKTIRLVLLAQGKSNTVAARYEAGNGMLCAEDMNSGHKSTF